GNEGKEQSLHFFSSDGSTREMKIWLSATEVANICLAWRRVCGQGL
uniref:Uncharacterized protein n=1 Tax=Aegilops tauschii subsp. strangulata TaxID=200361 RepID=A0A453RG12_AEGTS